MRSTLAFAVIALAARTVVVYPVLALTRVPPRDRKLIAAFGPRGLSSLLLALLPVFAGVPGSDGVFTLTCLVVLLSIAIHGSVIGVFLRAGSMLDRPPSPGRAESPSPEVGAPQAERITIAEMRGLSERGEPVVVVDVRARKSYEADPRQAAGSIRVSPGDPLRFASEARLSQHATLVLYCA